MRRVKIVTIALLLLALMMVLSTMVAAETVDVATSMEVSHSRIIYDVPFDVYVKANTQAKTYSDYDFSFGSVEDKITFNGGSVVSSRYQADPGGITGIKKNGKAYRIKAVPTSGESDSSTQLTTIFTLSSLRFQGTGSGPNSKVQLLTTKDDMLAIGTPAMNPGASEAGDLILTVMLSETAIITPEFSRCGDGVVAYFDPTQTGIRTSKIEACDDTRCADGSSDREEGESAEDCNNRFGCHCPTASKIGYLEAGYKVKGGYNCEENSHNCQVESMDPYEVLEQKFAAMMQGRCWPSSHPSPLYCNADGSPKFNHKDSNGNNIGLSGDQRVDMIVEMSRAIRKFFESPGVKR